MPGVAALIGTGRLLVGAWGGLFAGLIVLFSTYHTFFDRLALADPLSASAVALALYFGARLIKRINDRDALLMGLFVFIAIAMKLSALPYLGLPLAAALTLKPRGAVSLKTRGRWLAIALATEGILLGLFTLGLIVARRNPFANAGDHIGLGDDGIGGVISRIPGSAGYMLDILVGWVGPVGLVVIAALVVVLLVRRRFYLLLCLLPPALVFLLSEMQGSRYYAAPMSVLALALAVGLADLTKPLGRIGRSVALAALGVWAALAWLPFLTAMNASSLNLALPFRDYREYVVGDATGFGLETVRDDLKARQPQRVLGLLANCQALRYEAFNDFTVECPNINPNGETIPVLTDLMETSREPGTYAVLEALIYLPETAPGRLVASINDPSGRPTLAIYDLSPDA